MTPKTCPNCTQVNDAVFARCSACGYSFFSSRIAPSSEVSANPHIGSGSVFAAIGKKANRWMIGTIALASFLLITIGGLFVAMPLLSVWSMGQAAKANDAETFASYIDFPTLQENLKADLNAQMLANASKETDRDNPFAGFAAMIGPTIINNMVDAYVTPAGVEQMMQGNFSVNPKDRPTTAKGFLPDGSSYDYTYRGVNEFEFLIKHPNSKVLLTMERTNLVFWKLTRARVN